MSQSVSYSVENAVFSLLNSVSGLNVYVSNRSGGRLFPYSSIKADVNNQMLGNYTGVYDMSVAVDYSDTAAKVSKEDFDSEYCNIFEAFYAETPTLVSKLNAVANGVLFYMARITSQTPTIRTPKRAWQRGLTLNIYATPTPASPTYLASIDFSDHRNSMYVPLI
jgi:hypothetical protein